MLYNRGGKEDYIDFHHFICFNWNAEHRMTPLMIFPLNNDLHWNSCILVCAVVAGLHMWPSTCSCTYCLCARELHWNTASWVYVRPAQWSVANSWTLQNFNDTDAGRMLLAVHWCRKLEVAEDRSNVIEAHCYTCSIKVIQPRAGLPHWSILRDYAMYLLTINSSLSNTWSQWNVLGSNAPTQLETLTPMFGLVLISLVSCMPDL